MLFTHWLGFVNNDIALAKIIGIIYKALDVELGVMQLQSGGVAPLFVKNKHGRIILNQVQVILKDSCPINGEYIS
jgi:hypothetical protein